MCGQTIIFSMSATDLQFPTGKNVGNSETISRRCQIAIYEVAVRAQVCISIETGPLSLTDCFGKIITTRSWSVPRQPRLSDKYRFATIDSISSNQWCYHFKNYFFWVIFLTLTEWYCMVLYVKSWFRTILFCNDTIEMILRVWHRTGAGTSKIW